MGNAFMVSSYKGGVGKSTVALGVAAAFTMLEKRVLLVDLDTSTRCLDLYMGCSDSIFYDFTDVLRGAVSLENAVYANRNEKTGGSRLHLLSAPMNASHEAVEPEGAFAQLVSDAKKAYDCVIFDCPPGRFERFAALCPLVDEALVVCAHSAASVRAAEKTASELSECGAREIRMVINCFTPYGIREGSHRGIVDVIEDSHIALAGIVEYNATLRVGQERGLTAFDLPIPAIRRQFTDIARRLDGYEVNLSSRYSGVKIKKLFFKSN